MIRAGLRNLVILGATGCVISLSGCSMPAIDAGHEGVLVTQPILFGHGGVEPVPATTGRAMVAPTTEVIDVDIRPVQHSEHFEIISAENAPVSFDAFLNANVLEGRSPELISRFGPNNEGWKAISPIGTNERRPSTGGCWPR